MTEQEHPFKEENNMESSDSNLNPIEKMEHQFSNRLDLSELQNGVTQVRNEISKVIVGQKDLVDLLIVSLLANGHVLIEGVPGIAKTLTAKLLAKCLNTDFSRIQFTPDLMPSDVLGTAIFNFKTSEFNFKAGPIFSNIILIDEINRAPAKTQSALFEVMEERQITIDGVTRKMPPPFMVLATQNPVEQEGTYRLPEAQLDRFLFKINVDYPSLEEEVQIIERFHTKQLPDPLAMINPVLNVDQIARYQSLIGGVIVEQNLMQYIAQIVHNTRENKNLYLGASPRASLALLKASKAYAAMNGRDFVKPEDIQWISKAVLRHRIMLSPEKEMEGATTDDIIKEVVQQIEVPR